MGRTIDGDDFLKQSTELYEHAGWDEREVHFSLADIRCNLEMMPTVEAEPIRHGKWIYGENLDGFDGYRCSHCMTHFAVDDVSDYHYCPYCGAKIVRKEE